MYYSDDPVADFDRYDMEMERRRARLPQCEDKKCRHRTIDDDFYYDIEGEILCEECMKRRYRRYTEDLVNAYE
jgi:hypothetical protein